LNVFFVNWYLDGNFISYGPSSVAHMASSSSSSSSSDPFDLIFPKMTKCTLRTYGPSGTLQNHDSLCVLPVNIFNEKIFLLLWFALMSLAFIVLVHHVCGLIISIYPGLRKKYLGLWISPERKKTKRKLDIILGMTSYGDWMALLLLARNTDRVVFSELIDCLAYPDFDWDREPLDDVNKALMERRDRAVTGQKGVTENKQKTHFAVGNDENQSY